MTRIAVIDDWMGVASTCADWNTLAAETVFFSEPFASEDAAALALAEFDIIVPMRERFAFPASLLSRLSRLKLLALTGVNAPHVDLAFCSERGITLCGSGAYSAAATAELTLALMLVAMRDLVAADRGMRDGSFQHGLLLGDTLEGKILGLVGLGRIGARVARYAAAFGMQIQAWSPHLTPERAAQAGATIVAKAELFACADIVSIHLVHSPATHHVVDTPAIAMMKPGALLVNTARAGLIDGLAMLVALRENRIRVALDVFEKEPLPPEHPLLAMSGATLSPHLGFSSRPGFPLFYQQSVENIRAFLVGAPIRVIGEAQSA